MQLLHTVLHKCTIIIKYPITQTHPTVHSSYHYTQVEIHPNTGTFSCAILPLENTVSEKVSYVPINLIQSHISLIHYAI